MRILGLFSLFVVSLAAQLAPPKQDYLIVPGTRIGPFLSDTGHGGLRRVFGAANVTDQKIPAGEGTEALGTVIYKNDPTRRLEILWKDDKPQNPPASIFICRGSEKPCQWQTQSGISTGTTLLKLEELNGRPFQLTGFFWDYGGGISSWKGGKLEKELQKGGRLMLFLDVSQEAVDKLPKADQEAITGDKLLRSDLPALRKLNPKVRAMTLFGFTAE